MNWNKLISAFFTLLILFLYGANFIQAAGLSLTKLEQHINITNGEFLTQVTNDTPTNNSLGLVRYDSSQYTGASVYFEIVARCVDCDGSGNKRVSASLYDSEGNVESTLTTTSENNDLVRSPTSLSLDTDNYTVRFHLDDVDPTPGTAYLTAARLIVVQSAANLTDTQAQIEVGHYENDETSTSATGLTAPKYYQFDADQFSGTVNAYFEATMRTNNNNATVTYEFDDYDQAGGSPEQWATTPQYMADGNLGNYASTSSDGDTQLLTSTDYPGSRSEVITKVELRAYTVQTTDTTGSITLRPVFSGSDGDDHEFTPPTTAAWSSYIDITDDTNAPETWSWSDIDSLDADVVWNANAGSNTGSVSKIEIQVTYEDTSVLAYAQLYNTTDSQIVGNSTISTSSNSFTRVRSDALDTNWDTTNDDVYVVRIYTSDAGNPIDLSNAKIIIDQTDSSNISKVETILPQLTTSSTHNNSTFTTQNFLNQFTPANFNSGNVTRAFFEVNMRASAGTANARLYNRSDSQDIDTPTDSLVTTTETDLQILRSSNLFDNSDWPTTNVNLDTTINAVGTSTTTITNSWVIIQSIALDPQLTFLVEGVAADETNNGVTSSVETTVTTIPFGNITANIPKYATHKLTLTTNEAVSDYVINMALTSQIQGNYPGNNLDPFVGNSAAWDDPKSWTSPTGTQKNDNTGWIGANTSDTDVDGWSLGSNLWGPLGTDQIEVARSDSGDTETVYVSLGVEVGVLQPSDTYSGQIIYYVLPTF